MVMPPDFPPCDELLPGSIYDPRIVLDRFLKEYHEVAAGHLERPSLLSSVARSLNTLQSYLDESMAVMQRVPELVERKTVLDKKLEELTTSIKAAQAPRESLLAQMRALESDLSTLTSELSEAHTRFQFFQSRGSAIRRIAALTQAFEDLALSPRKQRRKLAAVLVAVRTIAFGTFLGVAFLVKLFVADQLKTMAGEWLTFLLVFLLQYFGTSKFLRKYERSAEWDIVRQVCSDLKRIGDDARALEDAFIDEVGTS